MRLFAKLGNFRSSGLLRCVRLGLLEPLLELLDINRKRRGRRAIVGLFRRHRLARRFFAPDS
jgi:hypothetical protein